MRKESGHPLQPADNVDCLRISCFSSGVDIHEGRHEVRERARRNRFPDRHDQFVGRLRQQLRGFDRLALEINEAGLDLVGRGHGSGILNVSATKNGQPFR